MSILPEQSAKLSQRHPPAPLVVTVGFLSNNVCPGFALLYCYSIPAEGSEKVKITRVGHARGDSKAILIGAPVECHGPTRSGRAFARVVCLRPDTLESRDIVDAHALSTHDEHTAARQNLDWCVELRRGWCQRQGRESVTDTYKWMITQVYGTSNLKSGRAFAPEIDSDLWGRISRTACLGKQVVAQVDSFACRATGCDSRHGCWQKSDRRDRSALHATLTE